MDADSDGIPDVADDQGDEQAEDDGGQVPDVDVDAEPAGVMRSPHVAFSPKAGA